MIRKQKRDVELRATKWHAELIINSPSPELDCELVAPYGHHWKNEDVHAFVGCTIDNGMTAPEAWGDLWDRCSEGPELCTPETCALWHDGHCGFWGPVPSGLPKVGDNFRLVEGPVADDILKIWRKRL